MPWYIIKCNSIVFLLPPCHLQAWHYSLWLNVVKGYKLGQGETSADLAILAAVVRGGWGLGWVGGRESGGRGWSGADGGNMREE